MPAWVTRGASRLPEEGARAPNAASAAATALAAEAPPQPGTPPRPTAAPRKTPPARRSAASRNVCGPPPPSWPSSSSAGEEELRSRRCAEEGRLSPHAGNARGAPAACGGVLALATSSPRRAVPRREPSSRSPGVSAPGVSCWFGLSPAAPGFLLDSGGPPLRSTAGVVRVKRLPDHAPPSQPPQELAARTGRECPSLGVHAPDGARQESGPATGCRGLHVADLLLIGAADPRPCADRGAEEIPVGLGAASCAEAGCGDASRPRADACWGPRLAARSGTRRAEGRLPVLALQVVGAPWATGSA
mmetsp:Transcript_70420/g.199866  ORF Transcript_70420/g.199866 Transcript_70420/m.199866 type:complete len:303 (+) Transcript_70420:1039-1947(+)